MNNSERMQDGEVARKAGKKEERSAEEINVAYEALEKMRRLNLEVECEEHGVAGADPEACTCCLLENHERFPRLQRLAETLEEDETFGFGSLWSGRKSGKARTPTVVLPRVQKLMDSVNKARVTPCLVCASPSCSRHSSAAFRKENITLCLSCERFFSLEYLQECMASADLKERSRNVDRIIDLYDRCMLLLRYSSRYIPDVATALETSTSRQNRLNLGSSGAGVVSGALGIVAAATILTPVGPPLLVASLLFGGSATAVQTGSEAVHYFSEPNQLADRVIALHGVAKALLRVTSTLRDNVAAAQDGTHDPLQSFRESKKGDITEKGFKAGATMGRSLTLGSVANTGAEAVVTGTKSAMSLSRVTLAAARTVRFAGGALSAAVLVLEVNAIHSTLVKMRSGDPCEKAQSIREILAELDDFPSTGQLDEECQDLLAHLKQGPRQRQQQRRHDDEEDATVATTKSDDSETNLCEGGITILEGVEGDEDDDDDEQKESIHNEDPYGPTPEEASKSRVIGSSTAGGGGGMSLLERIRLHKLQESQSSIGGFVDREPSDLDLIG